MQGFSQDQPLDEVCDIVLDIPESGKDLRRFLRGADAWVVKQLTKGNNEVHMNKLNPNEREQFREAKKVEIKSWLAKKAIAAATGHVPSSRLMQMRWVLTWKSIDDPENPGQRKAKARLVLRGFQDPDLASLPTSAPTMTRRTRQLFLQMAAQKRWRLLLADAKTAFLQGGATQTKRGVYAIPVPELAEALGIPVDIAVQIHKACYGLANCPTRVVSRRRREGEGPGHDRVHHRPLLLDHEGRGRHCHRHDDEPCGRLPHSR